MTATSKTAAFISRAVEFSKKSQREIANESGFPKPNVISMLKNGDMKIPLDRIPAFANACHVDPVHLLRLAMEEYQPEAWSAITGSLGTPLTANEWEVLGAYRIASVDEEVPITYEKFVELIRLLTDGKPETQATESLKHPVPRPTHS